MNKIEYPLSHTTVAETGHLAVTSAQIIESYALADPYLNKLGDKLRIHGDDMEKSLGTSRKNKLTEALAEADNNRDRIFLSLKSFIDGYLKWGLEEFTPSAEKIWEIIERHGVSLDRESYEDESALINSLLMELEKPEIVEALTILNQTRLISYLKESQIKFHETYLKSLEFAVGKGIIIPSTKIKKATYATLNVTIDYLNSNVLAKPDVYGMMHKEMAALVNRLNQKIRKRRNRRK